MISSKNNVDLALLNLTSYRPLLVALLIFSFSFVTSILVCNTELYHRISEMRGANQNAADKNGKNASDSDCFVKFTGTIVEESLLSCDRMTGCG